MWRILGGNIMDDEKKLEYDKDTVNQAEIEARQIINERVTIYEKDPSKAERDEKVVRENLFQYIERLGKKIAKKLIDSIKFLFNAMIDPRTPFKAKAIAIAALVYFISPIDLIPDVIPAVGFADDAAAIAAAVAAIASILIQHGIHLQEDKKQA
jgi:uncharacterized membrane protein YkvA (DUF1232 family)